MVSHFSFEFRKFQTKVTLESFLAWKKRKIQEKKDQLAKEEEQRKKDYKSGKQFGFSGREMFSFNPELATQNDLDDDEAAFDGYEREDDDGDQVFEYKELDLDILAAGAQEVCSTRKHRQNPNMKWDRFEFSIFICQFAGRWYGNNCC